MNDFTLDQASARACGFWRRLIPYGAGILLLLLAGMGVTSIYREAKIWRAHSLAHQAMTALQQHEVTIDSSSKMIAAYHLAPEDAEVLRACAKWDLSSENPRALGFYYRLIGLGKATREDKRDAVRACLVLGDLAAAQTLVKTLTEKDAGAGDIALLGQVQWQEHTPQIAIATLRRSLAMDPQDRAHGLVLAQMLAFLPDAASQAESSRMLKSLAEGTDEESLGALIALAHGTGLNNATRQEIANQLRQHPLLSDQGRLTIWELEEKMGGRDPGSIGKEVVDYFRSADLTRKSVAARWLYDQNKPELALRLAAPPDTQASQALLMVRLDALAVEKKWAQLKEELADPQLPLSQSILYLYRARTDRELVDPAGSHANWERARSAASGDDATLAHLADYALQMKEDDEAKLTLNMLTAFPERSRAAYMVLLQLEAQHDTVAALQATLKQMMNDFPLDPEPRNDWAYLSLLLDTNLEEASKIAHALVAAHPEMLAYRSTLALACLRRNDAPGAARIYDGLEIDWSQVPASWKMVYALTLAANGKEKQAQDMARGIKRPDLRVEELALLNSYFPGI